MSSSILSILSDRLPARYQDLEPAGQGGMGFLFRSRDAQTGGVVAIKMVAPALMESQQMMARRRFLQETRAMTHLSHPYIVRILEVHDERDVLYYVMEWIDGILLEEVFARDRERDPSRILGIVLDLGDACAHAHRKGILHRDLKPSNIFVLPQGGIKLLDFGLAKDFSVTGITRTGEILGTPSYMAPEQLMAREVDVRTDIYSLGVILFEGLTGILPFPPENYLGKLHMEAPRPSSIDNRISSDLDQVVLGALQIDAGARPQSMDELRRRLVDCLRDYRSFRDEPLFGEDWRTLLRNDLERLARQSPPASERAALIEGERRSVVILILRLDGLDRSQGELENQGISFVRDRVLRILGGAIERFGGTIDQYRPDGFIALFGSLRTSESDCQRAVRAGLELFEKLEEIGGILSPRGFELQARVGVDTEVVAIGPDQEVDSGCFSITRRSGPIPAGGVWVTPALRRRLREDWTSDDGGVPDESLHRILAVPPRSTAERSLVDTSRSPWIGRQPELERLKEAWEEVLPAALCGPPTMVTLRGEPGIGKSRLVEEFLGAVPASALRIQCPTIVKAPYGMITALVRTILEIPEGTDLTSDQLDRILQARIGNPPVRGSSEGDDGSGTLPDPTDRGSLLAPLAFLLGVMSSGGSDPSPERTRQTIQYAACALVLEVVRCHRITTGQPFLVCIDDLQEIDGLSQEVLECLLTDRNLTMFLILVYRSPFEIPVRWKRYTHHVDIPVGPLSPGDARRFLVDALEKARLDRSRVPDIMERAGGNPLFLEESVRYLHAGTLWAGTGSPQEVPDVPASLQTLVESRFDDLPRTVRTVLQACSVVGTEIDVALLELMIRGTCHEDFPLASVLADLERMRFLERVDPGDRYRFRQSIARDVIYSTVLESNRKLWHVRVARAIEEIHRENLEDQQDRLAYHLGRTDHLREALDHTLEALRRAARYYDHERTIRLAADGLRLVELTGGGDSTRFEILSMRARVYEMTGQKEEQSADLQHMLKIADSLGDSSGRSQVLNRLSWLCWWNGEEYDLALELSEEARALASRSDDRANEAWACRNLGCAHSMAGDSEKALGRHQEARELYRALEDRSGEAASLCSMAIDTWALGDVDTAVNRVQEAMVLDRNAGNLRGVGRELRVMGDIWHGLGMSVAAIKAYGRALENDRRIGYRMGQALNLAALGRALLDQEDHEPARDRLEEALEIATAIHSRRVQVQCLLDLSRIETGGSDAPAPTDRIKEAIRLARDAGIESLAVIGLGLQARRLLEEGDVGQAEERSREALESARVLRSCQVHLGEIWYVRARVLEARGLDQEARHALDQAWNFVETRARRLYRHDHRRSFLEQVPVNREILDAHGGASADSGPVG